MIKAMVYSNVISDDVENLVVTILKGIELADRLSAAYSLELTSDDVAIIARL